MNIQDFKDRINSLISFVGFDYKDKPCGIEPINRSHFDMWYNDTAFTAKSIDEVMSAPIFNGQSLTDIYDKIVITDC